MALSRRISQIARNNVLLTPVSVVTDLPLRRLALGLGAGVVVTELVARKDVMRPRPAASRGPAEFYGDTREAAA